MRTTMKVWLGSNLSVQLSRCVELELRDLPFGFAGSPRQATDAPPWSSANGESVTGTTGLVELTERLRRARLKRGVRPMALRAELWGEEVVAAYPFQPVATLWDRAATFLVAHGPSDTSNCRSTPPREVRPGQP